VVPGPVLSTVMTESLQWATDLGWETTFCTARAGALDEWEEYVQKKK